MYQNPNYQAQEEKRQYYDNMRSNLMQMKSNPDFFRLYLGVQGNLPSFSVGNCMLIARFYPNATNVHLHSTWSKHGISPLKGCTGFGILVPTDKYRRPDGSLAQGYDVKRAFDVMQTTAGKDYVRQQRSDDRTMLRQLLEYQRGAWDFQAVTHCPDPGKNIQYVSDGSRYTIYIQKNQTFDGLYPALAREVFCADIGLRNGISIAEAMPRACCCAYMLCQKHQIDPGQILQQLPEPEKIMGTDPEAHVKQLNTMLGDYRTLLAELPQKEKMVEREI